MTPAQEPGQERWRRRGVGGREQRMHIGATRAGRGDRKAIDDLLAGQLQLAHQPPDGRHEPDHGEHGLLGQHPQPVAALHVQQLVTDDGAARVGRRGGQLLRQQHDGR
jgi:hypothetical protein